MKISWQHFLIAISYFLYYFSLHTIWTRFFFFFFFSLGFFSTTHVSHSFPLSSFFFFFFQFIPDHLFSLALSLSLSLHFLFLLLFSFLFSSLHTHTHTHTQPTWPSSISFLFFFYLVLIHFVVTMELRQAFMLLICCFYFDFRFFVLIKFVFFPVLELLLCLCFDSVIV